MQQSFYLRKGRAGLFSAIFIDPLTGRRTDKAIGSNDEKKATATVERAYSHLKDNLIPKSIYVKGYTKVSFVMFSAVLPIMAPSSRFYKKIHARFMHDAFN